MKRSLLLLSLVLLWSCGEKRELTDQEKMEKLPMNSRVEVQAIQAKIDQFNEMKERIGSFAGKADATAEEDLTSNYPGFAEEIKLAGSLREQINQIDARIIDLERQKRKILDQVQ